MNYNYWKEYFQLNQTNFDHLDWEVADDLTDDEKREILSSLQQFQKGENSEGKHLYSYSKTFPDPMYVECIKLFIKEEQRHALILGKFMSLHDIPKIKEHWMDSVFRGLRKFSGLENTLIVLTTAEIIAKVYYKGLAAATGSVLLKRICSQILEDEDQHLAFQSFTLHHLYKTSPRWRQIITRSWHRLLMTGTIFMVWMGHRRVLKRGGYFFSKFFMENMLVYFEVENGIKSSVIPYLSYSKLYSKIRV